MVTGWEPLSSRAHFAMHDAQFQTLTKIQFSERWLLLLGELLHGATDF
jgi:hypothetical protein